MSAHRPAADLTDAELAADLDGVFGPPLPAWSPQPRFPGDADTDRALPWLAEPGRAAARKRETAGTPVPAVSSIERARAAVGVQGPSAGASRDTAPQTRPVPAPRRVTGLLRRWWG